MAFAQIYLTENTLKILLGEYEDNPLLLTMEEARDIQAALQYIKDEQTLKNNQVKDIPIPKGYTTLPINSK